MLARSLLSRQVPPALARRHLLVSCCLASLALALLCGVSPAGAIVTSVEGQKYGVEPAATAEHVFIPDLNALQYAGGPVMHANNVYAIYWDPAVLRPGDPGRPGKYHGDWQQLVNEFLANVAGESGTLGNVFALTGQYTETGGARAAYKMTFRGGSVDRETYPLSGCTDPDHALNKNFACFTDQQLREQLASFIAANHLVTGSETIFLMLTPPGVTVCLTAGTCSDSSDVNPFKPASTLEEESFKRSFCSYHSTASIPGGATALYAAIPWTAGTSGSQLEGPAHGSVCQDGTERLEEPNQDGLSPDGTYDHALPDVLINQIASQLIATATNPNLNGWFEPATGDELPDQCRNWFERTPVVQGSNTVDEHTQGGTEYNQTIGGHTYYLNTEYNQASLYFDYPGIPCELHDNLVPSFTSPVNLQSGATATFDGNESDVALGQSADPTPSSQPVYRAIFSWNFGDGTKASGPGYSESNPTAPLYASVAHSYQYAGRYEVTLTVTDAAGNEASTTHEVTVSGTPKPLESGPPSTESGGSTTSGSTTSSASSGSTGTASTHPASSSGAPGPAAVPAIPGPLASAAVVSHSLKSALSKSGLVVRYTVNEQVAGHFDVLLSRTIAHRLGITGTPATGLAAGTPPQLVIAKAILVTTKGGASTVHIEFSSRTAARLRRLHKVSLMLRLMVRNASSHTPVFTTVLNTVTLSG